MPPNAAGMGAGSGVFDLGARGIGSGGARRDDWYDGVDRDIFSVLRSG